MTVVEATPPGSWLSRLARGHRWSYRSPRHDPALPADLDATVMGLDARDRLHAKQGRRTARVVFRTDAGSVSVYLKRHDRLPWSTRLAALVDPAGHPAPAAAEFAHLERARALGVAVPEVVAAGERVAPWGRRAQGYLLVAELAGCLPLHEAIPVLSGSLDARAFERLKRGLVAELAEAVARLHSAGAFHKDLYLCHFFLDMGPAAGPGRRLTLIDLHRMAEHRWFAPRWRAKDLGQLLFSTFGVEGITPRDLSRFWGRYRRLTRPRRPDWLAGMVRRKAARYEAHNRPGGAL